MEQVYLGDGVYGRFDGYQIWLEVDRGEGKEEIALEPDVLKGLARFIQSIRDKFDVPDWAKP